MEEIWLPAKGYEGLAEVSNLGRFKILEKRVLQPAGRHPSPWWRVYKERIREAKDNYFSVGVMVDGVRKVENLHRVVAKTFIPNPEGLPEVNHIDGNKGNNRVDNLEWVTSKDNSLHSTRILKKNIGSQNSASVLTEEDVYLIKRMIEEGVANTEVAAAFNVHHSTISKIKRGVNWKHVPSVKEEENVM